MTKYEEPTMDILELCVNEIFTLDINNGSKEDGGVTNPGEEGWG